MRIFGRSKNYTLLPTTSDASDISDNSDNEGSEILMKSMQKHPLVDDVESNLNSEEEHEHEQQPGDKQFKTKEEKRLERRQRIKKNHKKVLKFLIHFIFICYLISVISYYLSNSKETTNKFFSLGKCKKHQKKNIIFMVSDGMGPASLSLTRSFRQFRDGLPIEDILELDKHLIGVSRTRSNSSLVTDSAAGATAFSCALKAYNEAVGVDPLQNPCGTILEALKLQGYLTGLVVTTAITDATPAAFSSHVDWRYQQDLIAQQQLGYNTSLGRTVDLMIGGGRCHYLPGSNVEGCRNDDIDLIEIAKNDGWNYIGDKKSFDKLDLGLNKDIKLPLLSLLTYYNIPFDLDRNPKEFPSLEEEAITALNILSENTKDSDKGFFLLIEGSRIDHAGHLNDPSAQVREVLAYDKTFKAVKNFADNSDVETIIISTSDHETGGLSVSRQVSESYPDYLWKPEVLNNCIKSGEYVANLLNNFTPNENEKTDKNNFELKKFIKNEILENILKIYDYTEEDINNLIKFKSNSLYYINNMVSTRAQIGWSTHGHSAVDVNIYGYSNTNNGKYLLNKYLSGNHENIEIGKFMEFITNSDLNKITELIKDIPHHPIESIKDIEVKINKENDYYHDY
ncbi:hypothetical protein B5S31_g4559 [[Candida] boidinii]|uniref:Unnamed protein product n=1 Tax=Candida boidinii TaxID=5477 RepID=A0ACB5TJK2_CANBO|nr:hypothetical protein B5S31_g4559 [[Candida] boidinii]OWB79618.1 hypothetical protein B5S32_g3847 [[Candida] boidinii]GME89961.1 unnamed protein product [[Candida] boidinii]